MTQRTPAEDAAKLASGLQTLARRLEAREDGSALFTREDVDRIVENRLAREHKRNRRVETERAELELEVESLELAVESLKREVAALS